MAWKRDPQADKYEGLFITGEDKKTYDFVKEGINSSRICKEITEKDAGTAFVNLEKKMIELGKTAERINLNA
ncbi:MAG: hypothetical protein ACD_20C00091G0006 [uncultured bacterium]|nr:MAG: hypothetical protein ACD_20C00091G0006 [uncultured bacterium]HBH17856.1 hypothetical protein [Cyanobacteria bacterium UBA9579]